MSNNKHTQDLEAYIIQLESALDFEVTRRQAAEVVADWIVKRPSIYGGTDALDMANEYRTKYPKEPS